MPNGRTCFWFFRLPLRAAAAHAMDIDRRWDLAGSGPPLPKWIGTLDGAWEVVPRWRWRWWRQTCHGMIHQSLGRKVVVAVGWGNYWESAAGRQLGRCLAGTVCIREEAEGSRPFLFRRARDRKFERR
ncbi:hypothetical protein BKA93DRAFT_207796 [Sparassis latifolia]